MVPALWLGFVAMANRFMCVVLLRSHRPISFRYSMAYKGQDGFSFQMPTHPS